MKTGTKFFPTLMWSIFSDGDQTIVLFLLELNQWSRLVEEALSLIRDGLEKKVSLQQ